MRLPYISYLAHPIYTVYKYGKLQPVNFVISTPEQMQGDRMRNTKEKKIVNKCPNKYVGVKFWASFVANVLEHSGET